MDLQHHGRLFNMGLHWEMYSWYVEVSDFMNDWEYTYCADVDEMIPSKFIEIYIYVLFTGDVEIQADCDWEFFPAGFDFTEPVYQVNLAGFQIPGTKLIY